MYRQWVLGNKYKYSYATCWRILVWPAYYSMHTQPIRYKNSTSSTATTIVVFIKQIGPKPSACRLTKGIHSTRTGICRTTRKRGFGAISELYNLIRQPLSQHPQSANQQKAFIEHYTRKSSCSCPLFLSLVQVNAVFHLCSFSPSGCRASSVASCVHVCQDVFGPQDGNGSTTLRNENAWLENGTLCVLCFYMWSLTYKMRAGGTAKLNLRERDRLSFHAQSRHNGTTI